MELRLYAAADDGTSNGDYMADQRWTALRRVGEAAGWLIDPGEVCWASSILMTRLIGSVLTCIAVSSAICFL